MRPSSSALLLCAGLTVSGCGGGGSAFDESAWRAALSELVSAERAFAALASDSTVQHAFASNIAADAILFRPGPVPGSEALAAQPMPEGLALLWEPAFADVSMAGDLGYTTGPWRSGRRGADPDSMPGAGQYVTVWRRTAEGFRFALDTGIGHDAAANRSPVALELAPPPDAGGVRDRPAAAGGDGESLRIADQDLGAALGDDGVAAYRSYAAERVRVLRDGSTPGFGPDALIMAAPPVPVLSVNAGVGVAASGDLGYTWGEMRAPGPGDGKPMGYYLRIWRRQADGSWKLVLDLVSAPAG